MKSCLLCPFLCLLLILIRGTPANAHKDGIIQLKGDELTGLPKQYQPASLDLKKSQLRIGSHEMTFSPLLASLFELPHDLTLSASWYHKKEILPPYLAVHIQPKKKDFSYRILFNLDTLEVIKLNVILQETETTSRELPVALSDQHKRAIGESIKKRK